MAEVLEEASETLSGLSRCAGLVLAPKLGDPLKHIEFVSLGPGRALVVLITVSGVVENRIIDVPAGLPASSLVEASNYLSARLTRSEEHTSELQSLMRISYAVFCLKKKKHIDPFTNSLRPN